MLGMCLIGLTVRVAIAIRNTGAKIDLICQPSVHGGGPKLVGGTIWEPQSAAMIPLRLTIKVRKEILQSIYIANDGHVIHLSPCMQPKRS